MDDKYQRISMLRFTGMDIRCGGSFMAFSHDREIVDILLNFADFFTHESCGICTPCRAGNFIVQRQLKRVQRGVALTSDLDALRDWGAIMQKSSRCGLGKTAPNAVITSMTKFRQYFDGLLDPDKSGMVRKFDMEEAVEAYEKYKY
jgi:[NiFe] hydrogenase diaphorase moiety large subunit